MSRVEGVSAVPCGPAEEGVDRLSVPLLGITLGEAGAPYRIGDIDEDRSELSARRWSDLT
ncbi:hypothetical protein [Streptomyces shenzhenensis]|uniref:hypothetical protein n=1 Tax=Streptomyces shenzhenensis TaxID=943815 RepID=UPI0033C3AFF0